MNNYPFYDTSALLRMASSLPFPLAISSITLEELEYLKSTLPQARLVLKQLASNRNYTTIIFKETYLTPIVEASLPINNDSRIIACALAYDRTHPDEVQFITADVAQSVIANLFFGEDSITLLKEEEEDSYTGYIEIQNPPEEELAYFYEHPTTNTYNLLSNQYLKMADDLLKWDGKTYIPINRKPINSSFFGKIKPLDPQQAMAIDSLYSNQLTVIRGKPGSGKSLLSFSYLYSLLEKGEINSIYIFCNPIAVRDAGRLGFLPGSRESKLLDSQIGNFLVSKFGDSGYVERLVQQGKLILLPAADCRGVSIPSTSAIYFTEAQNSTIDLIKLLLQRVEENTKIIIEGDDKSQTDLPIYETANGLRSLSKAFRGSSLYGEVMLNRIHRSKLATLAENMK